MHPVCDVEYRPEALHGDAVYLCLADRKRDVICEILQEDLAAECGVTHQDKAGDHGDNGGYRNELDDGEAAL